jgi:hypothetical protein
MYTNKLFKVGQNIKISAKQIKIEKGVGCNENRLLKSSKTADFQLVNQPKKNPFFSRIQVFIKIIN